MNDLENLCDLWAANPEQAATIRAVWRDLGKALDELMPIEDDEEN